MNQRASRLLHHFKLFSFSLAVAVIAGPTQAAIIRTFDSLPAGDTLVGAGVLGTPSSPGGGPQGFNNTAAPGFGTNGPNYDGSYRIGHANLVSELGVTSMDKFTIAYAYKPDSPNMPGSPSLLTRQFRIFNTSSNASTIDIGFASTRQSVTVNTVNLTSSSAANPGNRLMDGDPATTVNAPPSTGGSGTCCGTTTEWVYFATTYEALSPTLVQITQYGMSESQTGFGLRQFFQTNVSVASATVDISNSLIALELGNGTFGATSNRPYDGAFDDLSVYAEVVPFATLQTMALTSLTPVPEPSTVVMVVVGILGAWSSVRQRKAA